MKCKGFLFDLDGTLVDSLPVVERSWIEWAHQQGLDPQEVLAFIHGKQAITSLRHFMPGASDEEIQKAFRWMEEKEANDTNGITALPGALALLEHLNALAVPWAIVTSGTVPVAHARQQAAHLPRPEVFITAERVARGKPEPDAYLLGARELGLDPQDCLVVEDAAAGLRAGMAAGCRVAAVHAPQDLAELSLVDFNLLSLTALRVERRGEEIDVWQVNAS